MIPVYLPDLKRIKMDEVVRSLGIKVYAPYPSEWDRRNVSDFHPWPHIKIIWEAFKWQKPTAVKSESLKMGHDYKDYLHVPLVIWRCSQDWRSQGWRRPKRGNISPTQAGRSILFSSKGKVRGLEMQHGTTATDADKMPIPSPVVLTAALGPPAPPPPTPPNCPGAGYSLIVDRAMGTCSSILLF